MLIRPGGSFDRAAIMREAHKQYATMRRFGWDWSRCLCFAWAKARATRSPLIIRQSGEGRMMGWTGHAKRRKNQEHPIK